MMNFIDRTVAVFSPVAGLRRAYARKILATYEGAEPSRMRKFRREIGSVNDLVKKAGPSLRAQARYLERNHDLARGALRVLVNNVVGPNGIGIEPQPRRKDGSIDPDYAKALLEAWRDWCRLPEVTRRFSWSRCQRLLAQAWFRDGEAFVQRLAGPVQFLDHGTRVPYSLELIEADLFPSSYDDPARGIRQSVERNAWGAPRAYWCYKVSPDEYRLAGYQDLKRIPAERMLHLFRSDRLHQLRGVSEFASVLTRLEDIKDYEESERVAAKIAAMLTMYVKKGQPEIYEAPDSQTTPRQLDLAPGMIIDDLVAGEEIGMIDSKRPNPNLITFRGGQLRAAAAGLGASYSSLSRDYNGTYSAQRQELVEQWVNYAVLTDDFVCDCVQPVWEEFVAIAHLSGVVPIPKGIKPGTENDAIYVAQAMPWIDPLKEAQASTALVQAGFGSEVEMIRRRGANPSNVLEQIANWRDECKRRGISFSTNPAAASAVLDEQLAA